jgi:hypothetical protein
MAVVENDVQLTARRAVETLSPVHPPSDAEKTRVRRARTAGITCSRCDATWTALGYAHCGARGCHQTFSTAGLFDQHRTRVGPHGGCTHPGDLRTSAGAPRMRLIGGVWHGPEIDAESIARRRGDTHRGTTP